MFIGTEKGLIMLSNDTTIIYNNSNSFKSNEISEAHQFLESGKSTGKITVEW